jgi:hypothetical protein
MNDRPLSKVLACLEAQGLRPVGKNGTWQAFCPGHDDGRRRGLSIREAEDGKVLVHCHHGRPPEEVLAALGLSWADLFPPGEQRRNGSDEKQHQGRKADDPLSWWAGRCGVPREWLRRLPIEAQEGAIAFTWAGLDTRKLRAPDRKGWWQPEDGSRPPLWPALPNEAPQLLVLCEGESDATVAAYIIEALQLGHLASAHGVTKGASARPDPGLLREVAARGVRALLLVPDADEPGQRWAEAWAEAARQAGLLAQAFDLVGAGLVSPSLGESDLRDGFRRQPVRMMGALKAAIEGLAAQAESQGSSVQTNVFAVGTKLLSPSDLLAAPAAESLASLPVLGQQGVIIRGWSHLLAAPPKCGKTELLWACAQEWDAQGVRVLWVTEETESIWAERLRRDNTAPAHVRWLMAAGMRAEDILAAIREAAPSFDVVAVDTLRHLFQADEGDNAAIARTISALDEAIGRDKTRIYLHHTRKAPGQHGERTAGGLAFVGGVDRQLELGWDEHDENRRLLKGVSRICPVPELLLAWEEGRLKALGHPKAVELAQVKERVLGVLSEEWQTTAQVLASLGEPRPSDQHVRAALKSLAQERAIERDPPIIQGEARGRAHRWRLAPSKFSSNGNTISLNQTCPLLAQDGPGYGDRLGGCGDRFDHSSRKSPADSITQEEFPGSSVKSVTQRQNQSPSEVAPAQEEARDPQQGPRCAECGRPGDYTEEGQGLWWCWRHGPTPTIVEEEEG